VSKGRAGHLAARALGLVWSKEQPRAQPLESPYLPRGARTFPGAGIAIGKLQSAAVFSPPTPNALVNLKDSVSTSILCFCHNALITSWVATLWLSFSHHPRSSIKSLWYSAGLSASVHHTPAGAMAPLCPDNVLEFGMKMSWEGTERAALVAAAQLGRWRRRKRQVSFAKQKAVVQRCGLCLTCGLCLLSPRLSSLPRKPTASRSICRRARPSSGR